MTSRRPPAITPDIRATNYRKGNNATNNKNSSTASDSSKKVVSFGRFRSSRSPKNNRAKSLVATTTIANDDAVEVTKEEAIRQYKLYRSSPTSFPSHDRIKLVKLPREYLPASLAANTTTHHVERIAAESASNTTSTNASTHFYWPAFLYNNLVEVVRDLSPNETPFLKAQLIVEYKKYPTRRVARLIGWNNGFIDDETAGRTNAGNDEERQKTNDILLFTETKLELLRLPCTNNTDEMVDDDETKNFCESLAEMEKMYCHLLQLASEARKSKDDTKKKTIAMKQFAIRFGYALDMALNCLSRDAGSEPLLPRIYEENYQEDEMNDQEMTEREEKKRNHVCQTPNVVMTTNEKDNKNGACTSAHGNDTHSPAEESMLSTAAVVDDYHCRTSVLEQLKSTKAVITAGKKRKNETKDKHRRSREMNREDCDATAVTKKSVRPATTSTATVARGGAVVGRSKPPIDKECVEDTIALAPATTKKSVKDQAPKEDTKKEIIPWKDVWATMKRCGWTWKGGSGLMTDYYYIKPKCKVQGGVSGMDYFVSVGDTMEFARRAYGWEENGMFTRKQLLSLIEEHAKYAGEVIPPLTAKMTLNPIGPWRDAWEVMLRSGWTWRTGSGLMLDYYYIKPGCKVVGGVEGQDYFVRVEDVQQFAMRNYGWRGHTSGDGGVVHDNMEDSVSTKDKKSRQPSSDGSDENTNEVPMRKLPRQEAKEPTAKMRLAQAKTKHQESTEEDDDDEETRSTFSQSGLQSKKLFSDECADEIIPPLVADLLGDETWSEAWKKMRDSGWKWRVGNGLMTDYFYIKPGCKVMGGLVGRDYFVMAEDVQRFAMRNYGWRRAESIDCNERKRSSLAAENKPSMKKLKRDDMEDSCSNSQKTVTLSLHGTQPSMPVSNPYEKKALWQKLQRNGWKAISAGRYNKLHDWYYIRPHCDPGDGVSKLGVDFFLCEEDAIEAAKKSSDSHVGTPTTHKEDEEEDEADEERPIVEEATSPIRSARKGTPAGPLSTPQDCRTRPQDPAIPLLSSPDSCSSASGYDMYEWHNLWPALERAGWRCIKAGKYNPLHNYYYVRPKRDPGDEDCVFGKHYFDSKDDVINYVKGDDNGRGRRGKKDASRKSVGVMLGAFEAVADE